MNFIDLKSGHSVEGDEIKAYRSDLKASKYAYLIAGVHGDEVEGVFVLSKLFEWLKAEDDIEVPLIVIPVLNVDGYRSGTRVNSHGVDLNRNLPAASWTSEARDTKYNPGPSALSEPENKFLDKLFSKFAPSVIITMHSWKPMLNTNGDCQKIAELLERHNSYPIVPEIEGHPTPGSLGEYAPEKYKSPVLTMEFPVLTDDISLKDIWDENRVGLENLLSSDLLNSPE
ncbi:MAG: succinylglutamate desuccinylase/aspartoacylase family protein [Bacteriovoracaceae bacterium]|nr:succinylglutamate desuccinylase/aspartoacylase family protein [Bacteriovoracaceae bacterium]